MCLFCFHVLVKSCFVCYNHSTKRALVSLKYSPITNSVIWMQCQLYFFKKVISYQFQTEYCNSLTPGPPLNQLRSSRLPAAFYFPIHAKCRIFLLPGQCSIKYTPLPLWSRIMLVQLISKWVIVSHGYKVYTKLLETIKNCKECLPKVFSVVNPNKNSIEYMIKEPPKQQKC